MTFWERSNDLGKLEVLEVYEYYDQPVLLACLSASNIIYLVVAVDASTEAEEWLCVSMSRRRFESVRSGVVDLHAAFASPEDDRVFHFTVPRDGAGVARSRILLASDVRPEWLPVAGAKIELPTTTLPPLGDDIKREAVQTRRDQLGISLDVVGTTRNEAPARLAGRVLETIQDTIEALAQIGDSELMFVRVGGGSFEMRLASADQVGTLNESAITRASEEFGRLVALSQNDEAFRQRVASLKREVADKYLEFLRALEDRVTVTTIEWASPKPGEPRGHAVIQNEGVKSSITAMVDIHETRQIDVDGTLIESNVEKGTFQFRPDEPHSEVELFSGKAAEGVLDPSKQHTPGLRFRATIKEVRQKTGGFKYTLVSLDPLT